MKIAYIGLGSMGAPQARLIARSECELAVYDPHPPALSAFDGIARLGRSAADAAGGADTACVCVRDDEQVNEVVLGPQGLAAGLKPGALILVHSTVSVGLLQQLRARLEPGGIALVDAPVTRTRRRDDDRFVLTMLGGETDAVARARAVVETFSTDVVHMGPLGAGTAAKTANNLITWVQIVVATQAVNMAAAHGVSYEQLRAVLKANGNLTPIVEQMLVGRATAGLDANAERAAFAASQAGVGEKDLLLAMTAGEALGMDMALAAEARRAVREAMTRPLNRPQA